MLMRIFLCFVFLIWFGKCFSQIRITTINDTTVVGCEIFERDTSYYINTKFRQGECMVYYDVAHKDSALHIQYFQNGQASESWYRNGQLKCVYPNSSDVAFDRFEVTKWYLNGTIKSMRRCYPDSCISLEYYENGQIASKSIELADSIRHYMVYYYHADFYENGQLKSDSYYPNTRKAFRLMSYYPSGAKQSQYDFCMMNLFGPYKEWYENGQLKIDGNYESFVDNGQLNIIGNKKTGKWSYYNESGKLIKEEFYENNILVKTITY